MICKRNFFAFINLFSKSSFEFDVTRNDMCRNSRCNGYWVSVHYIDQFFINLVIIYEWREVFPVDVLDRFQGNCVAIDNGIQSMHCYFRKKSFIHYRKWMKKFYEWKRHRFPFIKITEKMLILLGYLYVLIISVAFICRISNITRVFFPTRSS